MLPSGKRDVRTMRIRVDTHTAREPRESVAIIATRPANRIALS